MTGLIEGFVTIALVIALGALLAQIRLVDDQVRIVLSRLASSSRAPP